MDSRKLLNSHNQATEAHSEMRYAASIVFLIFVTIPHTVSAQTFGYVKIGTDALAFHAEKFPEKWIKLSPPIVSDSEIFIEMIGIPNIAKINELKLGILRSKRGYNNAAALIQNDFRLIIYDPYWAKSNASEFYLVLGHEAGHHFCKHSPSSIKNNRWAAEVAADRFAGAALKRFEIYHNKSFINEALKAATKKYPRSASRSHPPRTKRIEAIKLGYRTGSSCGNLAPSIRGFSRQER